MADQQEPICPLAEAAEAARGWRPPRARSGAGGACCRAELAGAPGRLYSTWLCASVCFGQHPLTRDVLRAHKPHPSRRLGAAAALGPLRPQPPPQPVDPSGGLVAEGEVHSGREEAEKLFIARARRAPLRNLREARHGVRRDTVSGATRCQARRHGERGSCAGGPCCRGPCCRGPCCRSPCCRGPCCRGPCVYPSLVLTVHATRPSCLLAQPASPPRTHTRHLGQLLAYPPGPAIYAYAHLTIHIHMYMHTWASCLQVSV